MRKVILTINDEDVLVDDVGFRIWTGASSLIFTEYIEESVRAKVDVVQLVNLGISTDELLKLRAGNLI